MKPLEAIQTKSSVSMNGECIEQERNFLNEEARPCEQKIIFNIWRHSYLWFNTVSDSK